MRFGERLARFFYGRNGLDKLNIFIMILSAALLFTSMFVFNAAAYIILRATAGLLIALYLFRMFSKNIPQRQKENDAYVRIFSKVKEFFIRQYNRIKYRKEYRYRKCGKCGNYLRLKYVPGEHGVKCPRCGNNFKVKL